MSMHLRYPYIPVILALFFLSVSVLAQQSHVQIRFDEHLFKLKEVNDKTQLETMKGSPDIQLFYEHFQVEDYQKYREYYYQGSCLATAEDYKNWRDFIKGQDLEIIARFILESNEHTLSIIQYRLGKDGTYLYAPFTLQKINNGWYLLNLQQSTELMQVKGFFMHINHNILTGSNDPALWSQQPQYSQYVSSGGTIDGKKLFEIYPARYDADHASFEMSKLLFHGISDLASTTQEKLLTDFRHLADGYQVSAKTKSRIELMVKDGNFNLALETIFQESAADNIIEVTQKLNQIMSDQ